MLFAVNRFRTLASLRSRLSSNPNIGAGLTIVVSGKMLRATCSPRPYITVNIDSAGIAHVMFTLVAKNSDVESGFAL
jgi:hypothetical protein